MDKDLGVRARRRLTGGQRLVIAVAAVGALAVPSVTLLLSLQKNRREAVALAQATLITGPPCPAMTAQAFAARGFKVKNPLSYDGAVMLRASGHVSCSPIAYDGGRGLDTYPVCQFTSPGALKVTTAKGDFYFVPGIGRPATVSTPDGVARCVLASNFTLD